MILTQDLGDTKTYELPLTWDDAPATLSEGEIIIFSAKFRATDPDDQSVFQKALGAGLTVTGSTLTLHVLRPDTLNLPKATSLVCDAQATKLDGSTRTLWKGRLKLSQDVTHLAQTSTAVHTTETPLPVIVQDFDGGDPDSAFSPSDDVDGGTPD